MGQAGGVLRRLDGGRRLGDYPKSQDELIALTGAGSLYGRSVGHPDHSGEQRLSPLFLDGAFPNSGDGTLHKNYERKQGVPQDGFSE